jgi:hypothetical protein
LLCGLPPPSRWGFSRGSSLPGYETSSRRFQSAWMGIIVHSTQRVVVLIVVLKLVLA